MQLDLLCVAVLHGSMSCVKTLLNGCRLDQRPYSTDIKKVWCIKFHRTVWTSCTRFVYVACNLRTCAVCRLHVAKYAVYRLHGTQSADCMVTVQTKDPSKTCDSFSKFQRNLRFSARINFLTKLPNLKENNLCLFDNGYYSFSCL